MSNDDSDNQLKPCPFCNHVRFGCRADAEWNTRAQTTEDKQ